MTRISNHRLNKAKYRELVLYITKEMQTDKTASTVGVNKVLFYSDFAAYRVHGTPITGALYRKYNEGPAAENMLQCIEELEEEGVIEVDVRAHVMGDIKYLKLKKDIDPDLNEVKQHELEFINEAIDYLKGKLPQEIIDLATRDHLWMDTLHFDEIPYSEAFSTHVVQDQFTDIRGVRDAAAHSGA